MRVRSLGVWVAAVVVLSASVVSPVSAQVAVREAAGEVVFRDVTLKLPGQGWQRLNFSDQGDKPVTRLRFERDEPLHAHMLDVGSTEVPPTLTSGEIWTRFVDQERNSSLAGGHLEGFKEGQRTISGTAYPVLSMRFVPDGGSPVRDIVELLYFPDDFATRGRATWLMLSDDHSVTVDPLAPDELDAVVASLQVRPVGAVLLTDDLSTPDAGTLPAESQNPDVLFGYRDGEYAIQTIPDGGSFWSMIAKGTYSHTLASIDTHLVNDDDPKQVVYLSCRWTRSPDGGSGYRLDIEPLQARFGLFRFDKGQATALVGWRNSDAIHQGLDANHLELLCSGSTIGVTINGTPVATAHDSTYLDGRVGFGVGSPDNPMEGRFSNVVISSH